MKYILSVYRNADKILNSKRSVKKDIFDVIKSIKSPKGKGSGVRSTLNKNFDNKFRKKGWAPKRIKIKNVGSFGEVDFLKNRVAIEVSFTHRSFIGIDLLKLETLSYSIKDEIDLGIMVDSLPE